MPLNLDEFTKPDDKITFNGKEFVLPGGIPNKLFLKTREFAEIDSDEFEVSDFEKIIEWIKEVLYTKNEQETVDKFINDLNSKQLTVLLKFIGEFYKPEPEDEKKKDG